MTQRFTLCALCFTLYCSFVLADEVKLMNGDTLNGKVTNLLDEVLEFQTDMAGDVKIKLRDIDTLSTDSPVTLELNDGTVFHQRLLPSTPGKFKIEASETLVEQELNTTDIAAMNRPPKPKPQWIGGITAGWTLASGNTQSNNISASLNAVKRMEKDRLSFGADYGYGEQRDPATQNTIKTEDWWRMLGKYDYFFVPKLYGFFNARYEKDDIALLDRRITIGGGAGYQWIETDRTSISTELGIASRYQKYETQVDGKSKLSLQAGYNITHNITSDVYFGHGLTYLPHVKNFGDYYLTTFGEITANFSKRFYGSIKVIFDYDSRPATGKGRSDTKYIFGIGWNF